MSNMEEMLWKILSGQFEECFMQVFHQHRLSLIICDMQKSPIILVCELEETFSYQHVTTK